MNSGAYTHALNFYYPMDTLKTELNKIKADIGDNFNANIVNAEPTQINLNKLNFNYQIQGDKTKWRPIQVFDDGFKTFIAMPKIIQEVDLPVLYLYRDNQTQLVNYRYVAPYYRD